MRQEDTFRGDWCVDGIANGRWFYGCMLIKLCLIQCLLHIHLVEFYVRGVSIYICSIWVYVLCCVHVWCPWKPEEDVGSPRTEVRDDCNALCRCWEPNPGSLQKQEALLTAEAISPVPPQRYLHTHALAILLTVAGRDTQCGCPSSDKQVSTSSVLHMHTGILFSTKPLKV